MAAVPGSFSLKPFEVRPEVAQVRTIPLRQVGDPSKDMGQAIHIRAWVEIRTGSWPMEEANLLSLTGEGPGTQVIELGARLKHDEATKSWEAVHTMGIQLGTWSQAGHTFPNGSQGRHLELPHGGEGNRKLFVDERVLYELKVWQDEILWFVNRNLYVHWRAQTPRDHINTQGLHVLVTGRHYFYQSDQVNCYKPSYVPGAPLDKIDYIPRAFYHEVSAMRSNGNMTNFLGTFAFIELVRIQAEIHGGQNHDPTMPLLLQVLEVQTLGKWAMAAGSEPVDLKRPTTQGPLRPDGAPTDFFFDTCEAPHLDAAHSLKRGLAIMGHEPMHRLADNLVGLFKGKEYTKALPGTNPETELWWTRSEHSGLIVDPISKGVCGLTRTVLSDGILDSLLRSNQAHVTSLAEQEGGNSNSLQAPTLQEVLSSMDPKRTSQYLQICLYIKGVGVEATPFTEAADGGTNTKRHKGEHIWSRQ